METDLKSLLESLKRCRNFQEYADCALKLIENPVLIFDMNLKVLASSNAEVNDPMYSYMSSNRYPTPNLTEDLTWRRDIRELLNHEEPVKSQFNGLNMLSKVLRVNGTMVGQINAVAYYRPFTEQDAQILELMSYPLSAAVYSHLSLNPLRGNATEYLLQYLLDGNPLTPVEAQLKSQLLGWNLANHLYVMCTDILKDIENSSADFLLGLCGPNDLMIRYRSCVIILLSRKQPISSEEMDTMEATLHSYRIICGISSCFSMLNQLSAYYQQALAALDIGRRVNGSCNLYLYNDYIEYVFIRKYAETEDPLQYVMPGLLGFANDDRPQNTGMLKTLLYYIKHNRSVQKTSQALTIHRNTVTYRVSKCAELLGLDLNDGLQMLHLIHSLQILEYADRERFF